MKFPSSVRAIRRRATIRSLRRGIHQLLRSLGDEEVCFLPTPGNAGDCFIHAGTVAAFDRADVRWTQIRATDDVRGRTVVLGGGGNLTLPYDHVDTAMTGFLDGGAKRIVLLPHTVRGHEELLGRLRADDLIVCRDGPGHDHVRASSRASVALHHDMAFHLDVDRFLVDPALCVPGAAFLAERLAQHGWSTDAVSSRSVMNMMRVDSESANPDLVDGFDASHHLIDGSVERLSVRSAWALLACVQACEAVHTDRLHVAIAGAMLDKPVRLRPNSYDKNASVYAHSLRGFPNVRFEPWP